MKLRTNVILSLMICVFLVVGLSACSDDSDKDGSSGLSNSETSASRPVSSSVFQTDPESVSQDPSETTVQEETAEALPVVHTAMNPVSLEAIRAEIAAAEKIKAPALKEIGSFSASDVGLSKETELDVYESILCTYTVNEGLTEIYNYKGEILFEEELVTGITFLENCKCLRFCIKREDGQLYTLLDARGNQIISLEENVGQIKEIKENERFLAVYFLDQKTDNEEEAVTRKEDGYYTGTVKVFDCQSGKYLESTALTKVPSIQGTPYYIYGDIIKMPSFGEYDPNQTKTYVTPDDTLHETLENMDFRGNRLLVKETEIRDKDNKYIHIREVYDHEQNLLFTTPYRVDEMRGTSDFYVLRDTSADLEGVVHYSGLIIIDPKYRDIEYLSGGSFAYKKEGSDLWGIVDIEGNEVCEENYRHVESAGIPGLFLGRNSGDKYDLLDSSGNVLLEDTNIEFAVESTWGTKFNPFLPPYEALIEYIEDSRTNKFYVIRDKDMTLSLETKTGHSVNGIYLSGLIVFDFMDDILYSLVTGEKLAEGCEEVVCAYDCIYIQKGDVIYIYEVDYAP